MSNSSPSPTSRPDPDRRDAAEEADPSASATSDADASQDPPDTNGQAHGAAPDSSSSDSSSSDGSSSDVTDPGVVSQPEVSGSAVRASSRSESGRSESGRSESGRSESGRSDDTPSPPGRASVSDEPASDEGSAPIGPSALPDLSTSDEAAGADGRSARDETSSSDETSTTNSTPLDDRIAEAPPQTVCANCDAPLVGPYCAQCGQRAAERIVPLHEMTREWVEDLFEFDIRIFRTLPTFFFKPGRLTDEYVRGRRVRYVRPLRLYLVSSFILFSLLAFSDFATIETEDSAAPTDATKATLTPAQIDSLVDVQIDEASSSADPSVLVPAIQEAITSQAAVTSISGRTVTLDTTLLRQQLQSLDTLGRASTAAIDSFARSAVNRTDARVLSPPTEDADPGIPDPEDPALPPQSERSQMAEEVANSLDINLGFEDPETEARAKEFLRSRIVRVIEDPNAFLRGMIDRAPIFMFLLLPLFAFLLKLLYIRRGKLYVQHLIFALHVHALFFLVFSVVTALLLTEISALHTAAGWLSFTPFAYLYIAMQHVYKQGWIKTGMKLVLLMFTYNTFLFIGVGLLALANFLLMG